MTEQEWLTSESSGWLLEQARRGSAWSTKARNRKYRLTAVTILREFLVHFPEPRAEPVLEAYERWCDGSGTVDTVRAEIQLVPRVHQAWPNWHSLVHDLDRGEPIDCARGVAGHTQNRPRVGDSEWPYERWDEFVTVQCRVIRDIFGNPFRPISFASEWRTDTASAIAREMYESRDFGAMPILADALQDAGCENPEILTHCQDANQVHVRGCWVVDLVLDKP